MKLIRLSFLFMILLSVSVLSAGRLNFMFVNNSDQMISDVKIYPTKMPKFISDSLLKTELKKGEQIYLGSNRYSDESEWTIQIITESGDVIDFDNNALKRFNTYTLENKGKKLVLKQSFNSKNKFKDHVSTNYSVSSANGEKTTILGEQNDEQQSNEDTPSVNGGFVKLNSDFANK